MDRDASRSRTSHLPRPWEMRAWGALLAAMTIAAIACGGEREAHDAGPEPAPQPSAPDPTYSPDAQFQTYELLRDNLAAPRHASDGGGRGWLEGRPAGGAPPEVGASGTARFEIIYEAGPHGIAQGGALFLLPSPFWDWDPPQQHFRQGAGYTEVEALMEGLELAPYTPAGQPMLIIPIEGRALEPGERIRITYGAGPAEARVDRYAEQGARIWLAVDGDGDGVHSLVEDSPRVDIVAGPPARLQVGVASSARPGDKVRVTVALLDAVGNAGLPVRGEVLLEAPGSGLELPERVVFEPFHLGRRSVEAVARAEGVHRVNAIGAGDLEGLRAESNPLVVMADAPQLLWGDLHGHSQLSDGTGTPDEFYTYARDVAGLDVAALTDHDHWGMRQLDTRPELWERIREAARRFNEPGRFITLLGYEWTSWLHGHRHVLYFDDAGEIRSSMDPAYETPAQLWKALEGQRALTFAHHSAGGPIATNWSYPPDPVLEPVTEVASVHGSSEALDSPAPIYNPVPGNFVRDALDHGYRLGFIGSGDSHDGHPGLAQLAARDAHAGLAAIFAPERSREAVLGAMRARHVYATNGPRIWLEVSLDGRPMGSQIPDAEGSHAELRIDIAAPAPIERIELVRGPPGLVVETIDARGRREATERLRVPRLRAGEYLYVRVVQEDGGAAWSSPFYAH